MARDECPPARACGSWPASRLARKNHQPYRRAQQKPLGRCGAFCRQLEARDAHVIPGDAAKAACRFEDEIMVRRPAHRLAPPVSIYHPTRGPTAEIQSEPPTTKRRAPKDRK